MKFGHPFAGGAILTRGFYVKASVYYLGVHYAADYIPAAGSAYGAPLVAMEAGVVTSAWDVSGYRGWLLKLATANGWQIGYAHMREKSPLPDGTHVEKGQVIGYCDSTGVVTGPHVHIDLWNTAIKSPEAVSKMGYYAHDPQYWIGREQGGEPTPPPPEEDDMAQVPQAEWNLAKREIAEIKAILYGEVTDQWPGEQVLFGDNRRFMAAANWMRQVYHVLFDDLSNDTPTDKRRLIAIGERVKAQERLHGLTQEQIVVKAVEAVGEAGIPMTPQQRLLFGKSFIGKF